MKNAFQIGKCGNNLLSTENFDKKMRLDFDALVLLYFYRPTQSNWMRLSTTPSNIV